jgi:excisionase family DNA binding protein
MKPPDDLITTSEAAKLLKVSSRRILQFIYDGRLPVARRVGTYYLVSKDDLEPLKKRKAGRPKK